MQDRNDVHAGETTGGLPNSVADWLSEPGSDGTPNDRRPTTCASCGDGEAIQWLRMVTDWEDYLCEAHGLGRPDGSCLIPLCNRCRAWAEMIEIAEMALTHLSRSQSDRIIQERNRFLETLNANLVRGIRVSEDLESFAE